MEIFRSHMDKLPILCNVACVALIEQRGLDQMTSRGAFQSPQFCDSRTVLQGVFFLQSVSSFLCHPCHKQWFYSYLCHIGSPIIF